MGNTYDVHNFSQKLFFASWYMILCVSGGMKCFSEKFAFVLKEWPLFTQALILAVFIESLLMCSKKETSTDFDQDHQDNTHLVTYDDITPNDVTNYNSTNGMVLHFLIKATGL